MTNRCPFLALIAICLLRSCLLAQTPPPIDIPADPYAAIAAMPIQPAAADGRSIEVVDGDTGKPIAHASVVVIGSMTDPDVRKRVQAVQQAMRGLDLSRRMQGVTMAALMGTRFVTNAEGIATFLPTDSTFGIVTSGKRTASWEPRHEGPIQLFAARIAAVEVRDATGKPARDVLVGLTADSKSPFMLARQRTNSDGVCTFDTSDYRNRGQLQAVAMIASPEPVRANLTDKATPDTPLQLKLPPCGQARFILYGDDEKPSTDLESATLTWDFKIDPAAFQWGPTSMQPSQQTEDSAVYSHVALGLDLRVAAKLKGIDNPLEFQAKGPTRQGEMVIIDGRITKGPPILRFRVLDQQGQPIANEPLGRIFYSKQHYGYAEFTTDASGMATLTFQGAQPDSIYLVRRGAGSGSRKSKGTNYRGATRLELGDLKPGNQSMADAQLQDEPIAATGVLVDPNGNPVAGVWLTSKMTIASGGSGGGTSRGGRYFHKHRVQTDDKGRFAIREFAPVDRPFYLTVEDALWTPTKERLVLQVGDVDELLQVATATELHGQLLGDTGDAQIDVRATNRDSGRVFRSNLHEGTFAISKMPRGRYDVAFGPYGGFQIKDVESTDSEETQDPRLKTTEWTKHLQLLETTVTDQDGMPLEGATVLYFARSGKRRSGRGCRTDAKGTARWLLPFKNTYIEVKHPGYEPQKIESDLKGLKVRLQPVKK
ncbi:MAG: hypothetical protein AB8H80_10715 [Planctomycetota bacterium]